MNVHHPLVIFAASTLVNVATAAPDWREVAQRADAAWDGMSNYHASISYYSASHELSDNVWSKATESEIWVRGLDRRSKQRDCNLGPGTTRPIDRYTDALITDGYLAMKSTESTTLHKWAFESDAEAGYEIANLCGEHLASPIDYFRYIGALDMGARGGKGFVDYLEAYYTDEMLSVVENTDGTLTIRTVVPPELAGMEIETWYTVSPALGYRMIRKENWVNHQITTLQTFEYTGEGADAVPAKLTSSKYPWEPEGKMTGEAHTKVWTIRNFEVGKVSEAEVSADNYYDSLLKATGGQQVTILSKLPSGMTRVDNLLSDRSFEFVGEVNE